MAPTVTVVLVTLIAIVRVVLVDKSIPQGFDEPCHIAAGIKWLDQRDYTLDPIHPPLARYAVALPLFLNGVRFPKLWPQDTSLQGYCNELGNAILNDHGQYMRNLFLARSGILPFFSLAIVLVFVWTRREFGTFAGCIAAFLFSTLPSILAFSGLAYTDLPTACTQFACLFAFAIWLEEPTLQRSLILGIAAGLAFSSKLTSFLFLPCAGIVMLLGRCSLARNGPQRITVRDAMRFGMAMAIGLFILWGSYAFSTGHLKDALDISSAAVPSFSHVPEPARAIARKLVAADPIVAFPELVRGVEATRSKLNQANAVAWYFFPYSPLVENADSLLDFVRCGVYADNQAGSQRPVANPDASACRGWDFPRHFFRSAAGSYKARTCRASAACRISRLWRVMAVAHAPFKVFLGAAGAVFIACLARRRQHQSTERLPRVF